MQRKEVGCPSIVEDTATYVRIKKFNPAYQGCSKVKVSQCFLYKRSLYIIEGFFKIYKQQQARDLLHICVVNNARNKSDIFSYKSVFQKTGLIIIMFGRNFFMRFALDLAARVGNYPILKVADLQNWTRLKHINRYSWKLSPNSTPPLTHTKGSFNITALLMESRLLLVSSNATWRIFYITFLT